MLSILLSFIVQLQIVGTTPQIADTTPASAPLVQIFVAEWCVHCKDLEKYLREHSVGYVSYDIERDADGRALYERLGGGGVPLVRVGSTVIKGFDRELLDRVLFGPRARWNPFASKDLQLLSTHAHG